MPNHTTFPMRIARFLSDGQIHHGKILDDQTAQKIEGDLTARWSLTTQNLKIEKLLAPLIPTDILCIGVNYRQHAAETGIAVPENPMLFIKSGNTLNNPGDPIPTPRRSSQIDYEGELAVVISRPAKYVPRDQALDYIL